MNSLEQLATRYLNIKKYLYGNGFFNEIEWQYNVNIINLNEKMFLEEYSWVVLNCGMNEKIIRNLFPIVSKSFFYWDSAEKIVAYSNYCRNNALKHFNNEKKIMAIINIATTISKYGFSHISDLISKRGIDYLKTLPFLGPITSLHFAKNIGFSVAKPDRHLKKIKERLNYESVEKLCNDISALTDDPVQVVDIVLWRYSTLKNDFSRLPCLYGENIPL
jgi:hypothetical protein